MTTLNRAVEMIEAAAAGDIDGLRLMLRADPAAARARNAFGAEAIHAAYLRGHAEVIALLMESGVEMDIHLAAELGLVAEVRAFLDRDPAMVNAYREERGDTPLHCAVYWGRDTVARLLLDRGADVHALTRDGFLGIAPLGAAVAAPDIPNPSDQEENVLLLVRMLLDAGADPNQRRRDGLTALHTAGFRGHLEVVKLLIDRGADRAIAGHEDGGPHAGQTPEDIALAQGQYAAAELIRNYGREETGAGTREPGAGEVFEAIAASDTARLRRALASDPSLLRSRDAGGLSPVQLAAYARRDELLAVMLSFEPELDVFEAATLGETERVSALLTADAGLLADHSADGFTPLHLAAHFGRVTTVEALLDAGADAAALTDNALHNQPLHAAAAGADPEARLDVCALLLERGAAVDAQQQGGFTALHAAAQHGDRALARMLLAAGADRSVTTDDGRNAAAIASAAGHAELSELLRPRG